jgi:hypothetical protein
VDKSKPAATENAIADAANQGVPAAPAPPPPAPSGPKSAYKYGYGLVTHPNCPSGATATFSERSYRIVHADIKDQRNFLPKAILEPHMGTKCCQAWGLSLYDSVAQVRSKIEQVEKRVRNWRKKVGDCAAELALGVTHGARTPSSNDGHFTFYEFHSFDPEKSVTAVEKLFP